MSEIRSHLQDSAPNSSPKLLLLMGALWLLLAVALLFYQLVNPTTVKVEWETATELETAGFYIYRSNSPDGQFVLVNKEMIPGEGNAVSGATYTFIDNDVVANETYYYILEEIEYDATANRYEDEMLSYKVPLVTWWAVVLTATSILAGLALLITGVKEGRN